jgi:hypothetical protein
MSKTKLWLRLPYLNGSKKSARLFLLKYVKGEWGVCFCRFRQEEETRTSAGDTTIEEG